MLTSLGIVPIVPLGIQNKLTCLTWPLCQRRYCSSENSCAPPPVPRITPISRFSSIDIAAGSRPASWIASAEAATARGTTRETCFRSRGSTQASSSKSGISPAMCTGRSDGSKREIRFTPDFPLRIAWQKAALPMPLGLMTPSPVITTRGSIFILDAGVGPMITATWDNQHNDPGPLYFGAILSYQVQLLQLRVRCLLSRRFPSLRGTRLYGHGTC